MGRPVDEEMIGRNVAGKFLVETFLGGGAMGAVYKAYQKSIEKHVAIKVLHREFVVEPSFVSRFEREAKSASLLDHINLMRVLDYGREPDGVCYIAMELLEGRSLFQVMKDDGRLSSERVAGLVRQTLAGLAVAHEMGVIHRDLKPENIVVLEKFDDDGKRAELVKVCDFGMAKLVTPESDTQGPLSSEKLTSHGVVVGTPDYMSPEQGKGERLDARSDLYAVGVMLYQMLTGKLPFSAETPIATLLRHVIDEPVPPSEVDPKVHPGLEAVCLRALAKRREDRFQTAREMRAEIRAVMEARGAHMPSALPPARLGLGSIPDAGFPSFDLRPPSAPRIDLDGGRRAPAHTPPQSHRISAREAIRDEPSGGRRWTIPVAVVLLGALGVGGFVVARRRHAQLAATPPSSTTAASMAPSDPQAPALPPPTGTALLPAAPAAAEPDSSHTPAADLHAGPGRVYAAPPAASLAVRGTAGKVEPPPATSAPAPPVFGVLAVPEVPRIEGASAPAAASPVGSAPAPASASGAPSATVGQEAAPAGKVLLGAVRGAKIVAADVVAALPTSRFTRCYRKTLAGHPAAPAGRGVLHIGLDATGHIGSASFETTPEFEATGHCITESAIGGDVKHADPEATGAEIDVIFQPE